jgi:DNA repair exonuclease SbcCD ATPase subunit
VFDVSNSINQGEVERLGTMRPSERQKLIDGVVGLDKIDTLMKTANDTALGYERDALALERVLVEPEQPQEPESWPNRAVMTDFLQGAERDALALAGVEGELRAPRAPKPTKPVNTVTETEADLLASTAAGRRLDTLNAELAHLPPEVDLVAVRTDIAAFERYEGARLFLRDNPIPQYTDIDQLEAWQADYKLIEAWKDFDAAKAEVGRLEAQVASALKAQCPKCDHHFALDQDLVDRLAAQINAQTSGLVEPTRSKDCPKPPITAERIDQLIEEYATSHGWTAQYAAMDVPAAPQPALLGADLSRYEQANARRPALLTEIALRQSLLIDDTEQKRASLARYTMEASIFDTAMASWVTLEAHMAALETRRAALAYAPERVVELRPIVMAFAPYERDLARYLADRATYDTGRAVADQHMADGQAWRVAKDALLALRSLIKQHLYPSLAKAASFYIAGMTGGQRKKVEIDEGFEILVDGQALETLSGSAKAVANLSVRLGLGRVLTHSVFPVVLADEIDASMDDYRAERTADILQQCAASLSQLLLVSHKTPEADFYISLGENSEQPAT